MIWTTSNVRRIIFDTAGQILKKPHAGLPTTVHPTLDLYRDLGLDSLQRMELAAYLNEFFGIFHTSAENYLLARTSLDHWTSCILRARQQTDTSLVFRTSGTTGASRVISHSMGSLLTEARFLAQLLPTPDQVISTVSANHIYGFIYTILLPALWNCPLRLLADVSTADITENTLLIGTPFTWEFIHRSLVADRQINCKGVSSTAPMPPVLFEQLVAAGVSLTEIYGSSDTSGLAYRHSPALPFTLFPYLTLQMGDQLTVTRVDSNESIPIPDRLELVSDRQIHVLGRVDDAVQIAGVNVYPAHIRQVIASCPLVADCDVYAKADAGNTQLYGAIRLRFNNDPNREACLRWIRDHLNAVEIPTHLYLY